MGLDPPDDLADQPVIVGPAETVVGTGKAWLTERSTADLKELFALRKEAVAR